MPIPGRKPRPAASSQHTGHFRGEEGRQRAEQEVLKARAKAEARREAGNQPFRYRISVGETGSFVVLDEEPNFYRFEHGLQNPSTKFFDLFVGCCAEWDNCPACTKGDPYYALYLTVIDLVPYTNKQGVTTDFARKLLVVKPAQHKKFMRAYQRAVKEYGTFRGVVFESTRDNKMDSAIGNDIEMTDEFIEESDLQTYVRVWKDRENKKHTDNCFEVFDYEELFPAPTPESISAALGEGPQPGTRAHEDRVLGRRTAGRRTAQVEDEDVDEDEDEDAEEQPVRRGSRGVNRGGGFRKPGTTARMTTRKAEQVDEDDPESEDEVDDTPISRARSRTSGANKITARKPAPVVPRRRAPHAEDADDDDSPATQKVPARRNAPQRPVGRQSTATRSNPIRRGSAKPQYEDDYDDDEDIPF